MRPTMLVAMLTGGGCTEGREKVDAPAPARQTARDTEAVPPLPPGTIVAPLHLDKAAALEAFERTVPRRFGNITQRIMVPESQRRSYAFEVTRDPFKVQFAGDTVVLAAVVHYQARAWYDPPVGPDLNGECGTSGEPPRARLVLRAVPRLSSSWRLLVRTRLVEVTALTDSARDKCEVSFLKLDMTGRVLEIARSSLERLLPELERKLALLDVRSPLERIWAELQKPLRLDNDSLWLVLSPSAVHLGGMHGDATAVGAEIGITASPRIVTGARPTFYPTPLPPLGDVKSDRGFSILLEGAFDYSVMSAELSGRLTGKRIRAAGGVLEIRGVTVYGAGAGRLALGLDFVGTARGKVWLIGTPSYDPETGLLSVPDLDFDANTANLLVKGLAWLKGNEIREYLREFTRISASAVLAGIQAMAIREMNRELSPGVQLSATIESSVPAGVLVRPDGLIIRARATGAARIDLGPEVFEKKPVDR